MAARAFAISRGLGEAAKRGGLGAVEAGTGSPAGSETHAATRTDRKVAPGGRPIGMRGGRMPVKLHQESPGNPRDPRFTPGMCSCASRPTA